MEIITPKQVSLIRLEQKIAELKEEKRKLEAIDIAIRELEKLQEVIQEYYSLEKFIKSPICPEQKKRWFRFMEKYPVLSYFRRWSGIQTFCSSYASDKDLEMYASRAEEKIRESKFCEWVMALLKPLTKDKEEVKTEEESKVA